MPKLPLVGPAYKQDSVALNAQDCVNLFVTIDQASPAEQGVALALLSTPGVSSVVNSNKLECRALLSDDDYIYAVMDNTLYEIEITATNPIAATITSRGTLNTSSGVCGIAQSFLYVMITDGTNGYYLKKDDNTFAVISDDAYQDAASVVQYAGGYFFVANPDSDQIYASALLDPTAWDALDFTTAERFGDKATALAIVRGELWVLGTRSIQVYAASTTATAFPFDLVEGVDLSIGCSQPRSVQNIDDTLFWLDQRGQVVQAQGYDVQPISTPAISAEIQSYRDKTCVSYTLADSGFRFYCLSFTAQYTTWCYNLDTRLWHELRSTLDTEDSLGNDGYGENTQHRHIIEHSTFHKGLQFGGSWVNGKLYHVSQDYRTDDDQPIIRQRTSPHLYNSFKKIHVGKVELQVAAGEGLVTGQGSDPQITLQYSTDRGRTWSNELRRSLGKIGEYEQRVRWHRLGSSGNWTFRIKISDPIKVTILEATWEGN